MLQLSEYDIREVVPMRLLLYRVYRRQHTDTLPCCSVGHGSPWPVSPGQSYRNTQNDSWTTVPVMATQCGPTHSRTKTHNTHMPVHIRYNSSAASTSTPAGPSDLSLCLSANQPARPHETLRRPCDMTVTMHWCCRAPAILSTFPDTTHPLFSTLCRALKGGRRSMFSSLSSVSCQNRGKEQIVCNYILLLICCHLSACLQRVETAHMLMFANKCTHCV